MDFSVINEGDLLNGKHDDPLPFLMDHLPEAFCKKAELELNETHEKKVESLKNLKDMIKGEKTLENINFRDDFLHLFLRSSKHDVEKALKTLKNFVHQKRRNNPLFAPMAEETFEKVKKSEIVKFLPKRTPDGCAVLIMRYGKWITNEISLDELNLYVTLILQQCLRDQMTQINGLTLLYDWKETSYRIVAQFTPRILHNFLNAYLNCFPMRYKAVHVVNHPAPTKFLWALLKPLLPEKIKKRVNFHSDPKDLMESLPASVIPMEYGGLLNEDLYEIEMSKWLMDAYQHQKQCPLGGQPNYY